MAKRVPINSKRRLVVLSPFIIGITIYFLFTLGYYGFNLISLRNEQIRLNNDLLTLQSQEEQLKNEINKLKNPEYLARYARENFLYSKDGEYIIRLENNANNEIKANTYLELLEDNYIYIIVGFSILILLFIIIVFKKNKKRNL